MQLATIPLIMLGPGGWLGYGIYEGLNVALPITFLEFSPNCRSRSRLSGAAIHVQGGIRSQFVRDFL